jgi:hypothetical protein
MESFNFPKTTCWKFELSPLCDSYSVVTVKKSSFDLHWLRIAPSNGANWAETFPPLHLLTDIDPNSKTLLNLRFISSLIIKRKRDYWIMRQGLTTSFLPSLSLVFFPAADQKRTHWGVCDFWFSCPYRASEHLFVFQVFDYDWGLQDDFMGSAFLDLTKFELGK